MVTYNGGGFDLPVLRYRAMVHKVFAPGMHNRAYYHRYTDDNVDLCDVLSSFSYGAKVKLDELSRIMGLPGKPDGIDGSQVEVYFNGIELIAVMVDRGLGVTLLPDWAPPYSPVLAKALMRRKLDAAFIRPEEQMEALRYKRVRTDPLVFVFPSDHRLASHTAVAPEEIANEIFCLPSKAAPAVRRVVLEYFNRAGIDLKPDYEVHNVVHAISMITSTHAVMLLPAYTKRYLPESITTRPVKGEAPKLDLVIAHHNANKSPVLKLLLSSVGKLVGSPF